MYAKCTRNVQAEHAELVGPLDTLSEYGTERLQQGISFLFRDKGHPSPNFWSNHRAALSIFSVPSSVAARAASDLDARGFRSVARAVRKMIPPLPDLVTMSESMDQALRSAEVQATTYLADVLRLLTASYPPLRTLWQECSAELASPTPEQFVDWACAQLANRPIDRALVMSVLSAGKPNAHTCMALSTCRCCSSRPAHFYQLSRLVYSCLRCQAAVIVNFEVWLLQARFASFILRARSPDHARPGGCRVASTPVRFRASPSLLLHHAANGDRSHRRLNVRRSFNLRARCYR